MYTRPEIQHPLRFEHFPAHSPTPSHTAALWSMCSHVFLGPTRHTCPRAQFFRRVFWTSRSYKLPPDRSLQIGLLPDTNLIRKPFKNVFHLQKLACSHCSNQKDVLFVSPSLPFKTVTKLLVFYGLFKLTAERQSSLLSNYQHR